MINISHTQRRYTINIGCLFCCTRTHGLAGLWPYPHYNQFKQHTAHRVVCSFDNCNISENSFKEISAYIFYIIFGKMSSRLCVVQLKSFLQFCYKKIGASPSNAPLCNYKSRKSFLYSSPKASATSASSSS